MVSWQSGTVPVTGGHLAWHRTGGAARALVLSHGLSDNGLCWSRFAESMSDAFDVIMLDARGHGDSARMPTGEAPEPGRDIAEAIDALGLAAPIVMGHSVGARASAAFAAAHPGRAARLVLEDPPLMPWPGNPADAAARRDRFRQQIEALQAQSPDEIAAFGRAQSPDWHADEFPAWVQSKQQVDPHAMPVFAAPWQNDFAALSVPTLLLCGEVERGGMVTLALAAEAEALNRLIGSAQIAGAGHNIRRENFADYVAVVRSFLLDGEQTSEPLEIGHGND